MAVEAEVPVLGDVALGLVNATLAVGLVASVGYLTAPEGAASSSRPLAGRRKRWGSIGTVGADPRAPRWRRYRREAAPRPPERVISSTGTDPVRVVADHRSSWSR